MSKVNTERLQEQRDRDRIARDLEESARTAARALRSGQNFFTVEEALRGCIAPLREARRFIATQDGGEYSDDYPHSTWSV